MKSKNYIRISVFGYKNKENNQTYVPKKCCEEKHFESLLIGEEGKRCYVLIKDFNSFMYEHFCCFRLQAFRTVEKLKYHIKY